MTINIKDDKLYYEIKKRITKESMQFDDSNLKVTLSKTDLEGITFLNLSNSQISDLTGIEMSTKLTYLSINSNPIEDISAIENLKLAIISAYYQRKEIEVNPSEIITLPKIFIQERDNNSIVYKAKELELTNCSLDGDKVILQGDNS